MNDLDIALSKWRTEWARKRRQYEIGSAEQRDWEYYLDTLSMADCLTLLAQYWPDKE